MWAYYDPRELRRVAAANYDDVALAHERRYAELFRSYGVIASPELTAESWSDRRALVADHQRARVLADRGVGGDDHVDVGHARGRDRADHRGQAIGVAAGAAAAAVHRRRRRRDPGVVDGEAARVDAVDGHGHVDRRADGADDLEAEGLAAGAAQAHGGAVEDRRGARQAVGVARARGLGQHLQRRAVGLGLARRDDRNQPQRAGAACHHE